MQSVIRRILGLPIGLARLVWSFVNPKRTAGRIAFGRLVIVVYLIGAAIFAGYTLSKKSIQIPLLSSDRYEIEVVFPDAKGLDRVDEPAAAIAGTPVGRVVGVRYEDGRAIATLSFDSEYEGKIFADATAAIRPASALQNLLVDIDPGSPAAGPLDAGTPIPSSRTTSYVAIDELTAILDQDTQAYITILLSEAEVALRGRGGVLRRALDDLGELVSTAKPISAEIARRRELLTSLVSNLDQIFTALGDRGQQLAGAVEAGSRTLEVTADREDELAAVTSDLAPLLIEADRALSGVRSLAAPLIPAIDTLLPTTDDFAASLTKLRGLLPRTDALVDEFEALLESGAEPISLMVQGSDGLRPRLAGLLPIAEGLTELSVLLEKYKEGMAQTADTLSGAFSVQDNGGAYGQVSVLRFESMKPENFGFEEGEVEREELASMVAAGLERTCSEVNPLACLVRLQMPGLPPVEEDDG